MNFRRATAAIRLPPLRPISRSLHTSRTRVASQSSVSRVFVGAAVATTALLSWRIWGEREVRLDAPEPRKRTRVSNAPKVEKVVEAEKEQIPVPEPPTPVPEVLQEDKPTVGEGESDSGAESSEEEEESSSGAFNPVTGEINWDCPCLGGMAHGPCGPQFREAFSCFVYSEKEPKGIDCVENFKLMQDCFREHPEVYGEEMLSEDPDEPSGEPISETGDLSPPSPPPSPPSAEEPSPSVKDTSESPRDIPVVKKAQPTKDTRPRKDIPS